MARRATGADNGLYLPQVAAGIRGRAAFFARSFPGIGNARLDLLDAGEVVPLDNLGVWSALYAVDPVAADIFAVRHPRQEDTTFVYDPATMTLHEVDRG